MTTARLDEAQRRLYEVFGSLPRPDRVDGCEHCVEPDQGQRLLAGPVSSLEARVLDHYAAKALTTWGDTDHLRYFLPRLLEHVVADAAEFPDAEIVLGKLALADWRTWRDDEVAAVDDFLHAWWLVTLQSFPSRPPIGTVLAALAASGLDLEHYLHAWGNLETESAVAHLLELVSSEVRWTSPPRMVNPFWDRASEQHQQVLTWVTGGGAAHAIQAAFDREPREPVLDMLAEIHPFVA